MRRQVDTLLTHQSRGMGCTVWAIDDRSVRSAYSTQSARSMRSLWPRRSLIGANGVHMRTGGTWARVLVVHSTRISFSTKSFSTRLGQTQILPAGVGCGVYTAQHRGGPILRSEASRPLFCIQINASACTHAHTRTHTHTYTHMHTHAHTCTHMHTHAHTYTHMHTHAHTCTHTG